MGEAFTAKDFRTWGGTLLAFRRLAATPLPPPRKSASRRDAAHAGTKRRAAARNGTSRAVASRRGAPSARALAVARNAVVRDVADVLGNTPAVCRASYIDPAVFAGWESGALAGAAAGR